MSIAPLGITAFLWAMFGPNCWYGGVIQLREWKNDGLWSVVIYCGGPDNRKIQPSVIRYVYVDSKAKDLFTGRLLLDEMRELLKSQEIVHIRFYRRKDHVSMALAVQKDIGLKLNLEESLP